MSSFRLRISSLAHACRMGASGLPISNTGWAPRAMNAELPEPRPVSAGTGPGPDGGAMNGPGEATQPTPGLGAKSGGESPPAAAAEPPDQASAAIAAAITHVQGGER